MDPMQGIAGQQQAGVSQGVGNMVNNMQQNARDMMTYQFEMGKATALLQAESASINQMTKALNTAVQNIRA